MMATPTTWTDKQVFAIAEAAFLCGVATGDRAPSARSWIGPGTEDFMPLVDQACHMPSRAGRRKALRFAAGVMAFFFGQVERVYPEPTTTPEDTLREAGISNKRQARYQRRMSSLLAGRP